MPDYVTSRLTIKGDNAEQIISSLLAKDDNGITEIDFNKIVPMPEDLNIVCGRLTNECALVYLNNLEPESDEQNKYLKLYLDHDKVQRVFGKTEDLALSVHDYKKIISRLLEACDNPFDEPYFKSEEDVLAYGKKALDNQDKYGYMDWYDWRVDHWGTKWNSCYTDVNDNVVVFTTAWSPVKNLIRVLSTKYPDNTFYYEYAGEGIGYCVGWAVYHDGNEIDSNRYDDYSKEAYEQAFDLCGGNDVYIYDEKDQNYVRVEE